MSPLIGHLYISFISIILRLIFLYRRRRLHRHLRTLFLWSFLHLTYLNSRLFDQHYDLLPVLFLNFKLYAHMHVYIYIFISINYTKNINFYSSFSLFSIITLFSSTSEFWIGIVVSIKLIWTNSPSLCYSNWWNSDSDYRMLISPKMYLK
jgi:hypothetical protein